MKTYKAQLSNEHLRGLGEIEEAKPLGEASPLGDLILTGKNVVLRACREILKRHPGATEDALQCVDPETGKDTLRVHNIGKAAVWSVVETAQVGPKLARWKPYDGPPRENDD